MGERASGSALRAPVEGGARGPVYRRTPVKCQSGRAFWCQTGADVRLWENPAGRQNAPTLGYRLPFWTS